MNFDDFVEIYLDAYELIDVPIDEAVNNFNRIYHFNANNRMFLSAAKKFGYASKQIMRNGRRFMTITKG